MVVKSFNLEAVLPSSVFSLQIDNIGELLTDSFGTRPNNVLGIRGTVEVEPQNSYVTIAGQALTHGQGFVLGFGYSATGEANSQESALADIRQGLVGSFAYSAPPGTVGYLVGEYFTPASDYAPSANLIPAEFSAQWDPGFSITGDASRGYTTDFDVEALRPTGLPIFYVAPGASGTGATEADPGSLTTALTTATARHIILAPGEYINEWATNEQVDFILQGPATSEGRAVISSLSLGHTWVDNGNNVWRSNGSAAAIGQVVDTSRLDAYGNYSTFTPRASVAEVEANPGSFVIQGNDIYLHTYDSTQPPAPSATASIRIYEQPGSSCNLDLRGPNTLFFQRVHFEACNIQPVMSGGGGPMVFLNSSVKYSSVPGEGGIYIAGGTGDIYAINSESSSNLEDGFDWHGDVNIFEYGTEAYSNGIRDPLTGSHNGSTFHDNVKGIRLNTRYEGNQDRQLHDINTTFSLNFGVFSGNAATEISENSTAFSFGREAGDSTRAWIYGVQTLRGVSRDLQVYNGSTVTNVDSVIFTSQIEGVLN